MSKIEAAKGLIDKRSGPVVGYLSRDSVIGYSSMIPTLLILFVAVFIPVIYAITASVHEIHALNPEWTWTGGGNYLAILGNSAFYNALKNGIVYTFGSVLFQLSVGIGVALLLDSIRSRLLTAFSLSLYLIPSAVITLVARDMFREQVGIFWKILNEIGVISVGFNFWADGATAMLMVIVVGSYKFSIFVTLMVLARLQSIPDSYYEAAKINGATTIQVFRDVTWPSIKGVVAIVVLLRGIWMFNNFDVIWILTSGGPGKATTTLPILAFRTMFEDLAYGLSSAIAVVMFVILIVGGVVYFKFFSPEKEVAGT